MVCGQPSESKKDKCYFLISGSENITINEDGNITEKSICEKLLGVNVDYKLKLNEHYFKKSKSKRKCLLENIALQEFRKK